MWPQNAAKLFLSLNYTFIQFMDVYFTVVRYTNFEEMILLNLVFRISFCVIDI